MNVYDSARMADVLAPLGYAPTDDAADRRHGHPQHLPHPREGVGEGLFAELGRLRLQKHAAAAKARDMIIAVAGCVAQAEGEEILRARALCRHRARAADLSPPAGDGGARRPRHGARTAAARAPICSTPNFPWNRSSTICRSPAPAGSHRLPHRCRKAATSSAPSASCPIRAAPNSRGRSAEIAAEARRLVATGAREITLLGQNVNAYHGAAPRTVGGGTDEWGLGRLIRHLAEIDGLERIRYTTSPSARHGRRSDRRPWRRADS